MNLFIPQDPVGGAFETGGPWCKQLMAEGKAQQQGCLPRLPVRPRFLAARKKGPLARRIRHRLCGCVGGPWPMFEGSCYRQAGRQCGRE